LGHRPRAKADRAVCAGKIDAFLAFPPEDRSARSHIGKVIVNSAVDRPWSQYFCWHAGRKSGIHPAIPVRPSARCAHPQSDRPSAPPIRQGSPGSSSTAVLTPYDYAPADLERKIPTTSGGNTTPRIRSASYALRLRECGLYQSSPQKIITDNNRLRFLKRAKARAESVSANSNSSCPGSTRAPRTAWEGCGAFFWIAGSSRQ